MLYPLRYGAQKWVSYPVVVSGKTEFQPTICAELGTMFSATHGRPNPESPKAQQYINAGFRVIWERSSLLIGGKTVLPSGTFLPARGVGGLQRI